MSEIRVVALVAAASLLMGAKGGAAVDKKATAAAECGLNVEKTLALRKSLKAVSQTSKSYDPGSIKPEIVTDVEYKYEPGIIRPFGIAATSFTIVEATSNRDNRPSPTIYVEMAGTYAAVRAAILKRKKASSCRSDDDDPGLRQCRADMGDGEYDQTVRLLQRKSEGAWGPVFLSCSPDE